MDSKVINNYHSIILYYPTGQVEGLFGQCYKCTEFCGGLCLRKRTFWWRNKDYGKKRLSNFIFPTFILCMNKYALSRMKIVGLAPNLRHIGTSAFLSTMYASVNAGILGPSTSVQIWPNCSAWYRANVYYFRLEIDSGDDRAQIWRISDLIPEFKLAPRFSGGM